MYSIKATNASFGNVGVKLTFSADSKLENGPDYVRIYVPHPTVSGRYYYKNFTGTAIAEATILIPTTTFFIRFHTDRSVTYNGFKILPLETTTYVDGEGYKDFGSLYEDITPSSATTVNGLNNTVESAHPYSNNYEQWWFWDTGLRINNSTLTNEYYIYRDDIQDKAVKLNNPKLDLQENAAGQLTFKMPSCNRGYNLIDKLTTTFTVYRNDEEIWSGRIISIKEDFYKNKTITCEGVLAYLNDTTQPQELYSSVSLSTLLNNILTVHNNKVDKSKRFTVAQFNFDTTSQSTNTYDEVYTNYESTWNAISNKILGVSNGYFTLTKESSYTNPNVLRHYPYTTRTTCPQVIRFGKNLLDFTKDYDATQFCTVILPLGARLDDKYGISMSGIDGVSAYTTIESVNNGSMYYKNDEMVATYGWIEQVVHWDDEENPELLLKKAKEYLEDVQYDVMTLEVKAVDLSYLDVDYSQMKLSQRVRVISEPHNLDKYFPITKISIPLDNPANTSFTLGIESVSTMSARNVKKTSELRDEIHDTSTPRISAALDDARTQASNLISSFNTGYITITQRNNGSQELYITEKQIPKNYNADNPTGTLNLDGYWRWNYKGLEFVNVKENKERGWAANTLKLALDMTGAINADLICAGKLNANIIQTGVLQNVDYGKGIGKDIFYLNLEEGILRMNASSLSIGGSSAATQTFANSAASSAATNAINNLSGTSIYEKLSNAGQGIYSSGGKFYINAEYIKSGTITGDYINGGTISGTTFSTSGSSSKLILTNGQIDGYYNDTKYGTISFGTDYYSYITYKRKRVNSVWTITEETSNINTYGLVINVEQDSNNKRDIALRGRNLLLDFYDSSLNSNITIARRKKLNNTNVYNKVYSRVPGYRYTDIITSLSLNYDTKKPYLDGRYELSLSYQDNVVYDLHYENGSIWWQTRTMVSGANLNGGIDLKNSEFFVYNFSYNSNMDALAFVNGLQTIWES